MATASSVRLATTVSKVMAASPVKLSGPVVAFSFERPCVKVRGIDVLGDVHVSYSDASDNTSELMMRRLLPTRCVPAGSMLGMQKQSVT